MRFKTLKHKILPETFGVVQSFYNEYYKGGQRQEICHSDIPILQPLTANIELMVTYWKEAGEEALLEQLVDYELVLVDMKIIY